MNQAIALTLLAASVIATPARAQEPTSGSTADPTDVPPPGHIVDDTPGFALGLGLGSLEWDDRGPYDDLTLTSLTIERSLWPGIRGRAGIAAGKTDLQAEPTVDTWVTSIDLQIVLGAEFWPFQAVGVVPYGVGGVGTLITNPTGQGANDLVTRSQSQWTYGGGIRSRIGGQFEALVELTTAGVRLADPLVPEERNTETIHNLRWEGRVNWRF